MPISWAPFDLAETNESNYDGMGGILLWSFRCQIIFARIYPLFPVFTVVVVVDPILSHNLPRPLFRKQNRNTLRVCQFNEPSNKKYQSLVRSNDAPDDFEPVNWFITGDPSNEHTADLLLRFFFCVCNQNDIKQRESILIFKRIHLWTFFVFQKEVERK